MEYLYTPRYCYISPLCFTAQRRLEVHDPTSGTGVNSRLPPVLDLHDVADRHCT
jgi:hypothetical protein